MCGRFTATFEFSDIRVRWNLDRDLAKYKPRFNIAPETSPNMPQNLQPDPLDEIQLSHSPALPIGKHALSLIFI
jgi:putative SOS response-associated peptidase YedK